MKNPNQTPTSHKQPKLLAAAAAVAIAASGVGKSEAHVSSHHQHKANVIANANPFHKLTTEIASLEHGGDVQVTAKKIAVPGPIGTAEGHPLVFTENGQTYVAYTQGQAPNFNQKRPADIAGDMAILSETNIYENVPLEAAHLDKHGLLVDEDDMSVGYATGGEQAR